MQGPSLCCARVVMCFQGYRLSTVYSAAAAGAAAGASSTAAALAVVL